jgi:hypothetical protein
MAAGGGVMDEQTNALRSNVVATLMAFAAAIGVAVAVGLFWPVNVTAPWDSFAAWMRKPVSLATIGDIVIIGIILSFFARSKR